jgi:hypothetical protein
LEANAAVSSRSLAQLICHRLGWYCGNGQLAVASAESALRKLRRRGLLPPAPRRARHACTRRLKRSSAALPPLADVPARVDEVQDLRLHLLSGQEDPLHPIWNDLIIAQHPCGDTALAGPCVRYLIGSRHGWLGALSFGPAAYVLGARDTWIGWSRAARESNVPLVLNLSRLLIRQEVRCQNLASKVLALALRAVQVDWPARYGREPLLVETFVERSRFSGGCFAAANWQRLGVSTGRGRLGPEEALRTPKDIWVYPLHPRARARLQEEKPRPLLPQPLVQSLAREDWCAYELAGLELGDRRRHRRAQAVLAARWRQPQTSFFGSFETWGQAKGAYALIEHRGPELTLHSVLAAHAEATAARMAAEEVVLLPQDTTTLNFSGLKKTAGLGPIGEKKARGLFLHSLLAFRGDGVPLGVLAAHCWARPEETALPGQTRSRNAKSLDEKESKRWVETLHQAGQLARRMPQTQLIVITDREGDLYELHDAVQAGPANLHTLIRAQHDRTLDDHQKLWARLAAQPVAETRSFARPRGPSQPAYEARLEIRLAPITIEAPQVGCKKGWPPLQLWAVLAREIDAPAGVEPLEWMLLCDRPIETAAQAWQQVQWYRARWGIEEWHRVLKTGCQAEAREFKTAAHLQRALAFDLIVAWRVLACLKLGRALPQLPARLLYTETELEVLCLKFKKNSRPSSALPT